MGLQFQEQARFNRMQNFISSAALDGGVVVTFRDLPAAPSCLEEAVNQMGSRMVVNYSGCTPVELAKT